MTEHEGRASRVARQTFVAPDLVPDAPTTDRLAMRPLTAADTWIDFPTCVRNAEHIRATRGGDWPGEGLTWEEDLIDLAFHQREFQLGRSFAYMVTTPDGLEMLGCVYVYPPGHPFNDGEPEQLPDGCDAVVNYWVTKAAAGEGLHSHLHAALAEWLHSWPFSHPLLG
jgi:hypothetical protein